MNITAIIFAAVVVGGVGILIGFFLGVSGEKFKVEVDEREVAVTEALPGNNCGGCGYAGCSGLAAAIEKGKLQSISVRLVEHLLQPRLVRSWVSKQRKASAKQHL